MNLSRLPVSVNAATEAVQGAVAFEKMWQPLNVNSRQLQTESKLSVISTAIDRLEKFHPA